MQSCRPPGRRNGFYANATWTLLILVDPNPQARCPTTAVRLKAFANSTPPTAANGVLRCRVHRHIPGVPSDEAAERCHCGSPILMVSPGPAIGRRNNSMWNRRTSMFSDRTCGATCLPAESMRVAVITARLHAWRAPAGQCARGASACRPDNLPRALRSAACIRPAPNA